MPALSPAPLESAGRSRRIVARTAPWPLALVLLCAACKDRSAPPPIAPAGSSRAVPASPVRPTVPALPARATTAPDAPGGPTAPAGANGAGLSPPITLDEAVAQLPKLDGDAMIPPKTTANATQAHGTWCVAGTGADAVAESLGQTMAAAGWTSLTTRGDATKAGVSGERGDYRLSYVVSASSAASCRAPGHYLASATLFRAR